MCKRLFLNMYSEIYIWKWNIWKQMQSKILQWEIFLQRSKYTI